MSANSAGYFHPPRRSASAMKAIIQGSAAHGPSNPVKREEYSTTYGVNM